MKEYLDSLLSNPEIEADDFLTTPEWNNYFKGEGGLFASADSADNGSVENIKWVFTAAPVSKLTGEEFAKSEKDLITQVDEFFKSIGGTVERAEFGTIDLTRQGIRASIAHGISRMKAAAFKAVPDVIKHGRIIDHQINWKNRGYDTYVIAAPITIGNVEYIAEVIITQDKDGQRFYLHEVEKKEKAQSAFKTGMDTSAPQASRLIIAKKLAEVNSQNLGDLDTTLYELEQDELEADARQAIDQGMSKED
ncbi:MAG: hypothetical protein Ta2G_04520 [Termitinemataceae bacterium]|nr:MAG: hypothetical protein Ta2G_04520 [Termitinemataceae bacterium]